MTIYRTNDQSLVSEFVASAGSSLKYFRYFSSRPVEVIEGHLVTLIGREEGKIVAYGHLDPEGGKTWLGACIIEGWRGKGLGRQMVDSLLGIADEGGITITLTVDEDNQAGKRLYESVGFVLTRQSDGTLFYKRAPKETKHG